MLTIMENKDEWSTEIDYTVVCPWLGIWDTHSTRNGKNGCVKRNDTAIVIEPEKLCKNV